MKQFNKEQGLFRVKLTLYIDKITMISDSAYYANDFYRLIVFNNKDYKQAKAFYVGNPMYAPMGTATVTDVIYENRACADQRKLRTMRIEYEGDLLLPPQSFQDPEGYTIGWADCCRNVNVSNSAFPSEYGVLLQTTFPALYANGQAVEFSTPEYGLLNGDYICANRLFTYDMSATDPNGDELRYYMSVPRQNLGKEIGAVARPYKPITWSNGSSDQAQIPGNPALQINEKTGQLSVKANKIGLFVFGVVCEKYRNGVKIGSVYHEFQLPVVDCFYTKPPYPVVTYQGQPASTLSICAGDSATLQTQEGANWAFQWQRNGDNIKGANLSSLNVKEVGSYLVIKSLKTTCADDTLSSVVKVSISDKRATVKVSASATAFCVGDSATLTAQSPQSNVFAWGFNQQTVSGMSGASLIAKKEGWYSVRAAAVSGFCSSLPDSIRLQVNPLPTLPPDRNKAICIGDTVQIDWPSQTGVSYQWRLRNQTLATLASVVLKDTGAYVLTARSSAGCVAKTSGIRLQYRPDCLPTSFHLFIPDAFTPNDDGQNDTWNIANMAQSPDAQVLVFNRWGEVIYESTGYDSPWNGQYNGRKVEAGGYAYQIHVPKINHTYRGRLLVLY